MCPRDNQCPILSEHQIMCDNTNTLCVCCIFRMRIKYYTHCVRYTHCDIHTESITHWQMSSHMQMAIVDHQTMMFATRLSSQFGITITHACGATPCASWIDDSSHNDNYETTHHNAQLWQLFDGSVCPTLVPPKLCIKILCVNTTQHTRQPHVSYTHWNTLHK